MQRALRDLHDIARYQLKALRNAVAVNGSAGDDLKDQQVKRALREIGFIGRHTPRTSTYTMLPVEEQGV